MELLQLSSISAGWININSVTSTADQVKLGGEAAFFAALGVAYAASKADPHWAELRNSGHFDHIDDGCRRLSGLTDAQIEEIEALPQARKEFARRMLTSKRFGALVGRLRYQHQRRMATA